MKNLTITIVFFLTVFIARSQVFTGTGGAILNDGNDSYFDLPVTGLVPSLLDNSFGLEKISINISHSAVEELFIYLESPSGTTVELTDGKNCSGPNYSNTIFDSRDTISITLGTSPFTGSFKPVGYLGRFNTGQAGNGTWRLKIHDYTAFTNAGNVISWGITFGNTPPPAVSFNSSNLPIVTINTNNQAITVDDLIVNLGIINNGANRNYITDPWNGYNGLTAIHIRGNGKQDFEKEIYTLETRDAIGNELKSALFEMPSESDWLLIPLYQDKSLLRSSLTYKMFGQMGDYAPRFRNVELVINDEYRGIYAFTEKPKRGGSRINVSKISAFAATEPLVTGGYILKIDQSDAAGWPSLLTGNSTNSKHFYYQYIYPKDSVITLPQQNYIKSVLDSFETVMNSPSFADPVNGYQKYIEVGSFIDYLIINELSKGPDAYRLNTYLYKDNLTKGGKIHIGPVWDYDIAWHNSIDGTCSDPTGWEYQVQWDKHPIPTWWSRFMQDTNFVNDLYCRWQSLRQGTLNINYLNAYIDSSANVLNEGQQRNFIQFPILGADINPNPQNQPGATYSGEVNDLKNWITNRIAWMDANISGICNVGIQENAITENFIYPFPNPFVNQFNFVYNINQNATVKIELLNVFGEKVLQLFDGNKIKGNYQQAVNTEQLAAGTYVLKLSVNNLVFHKKLIKLGE